ncbi:GNAT family N-acetyltransferase [Dickeya dadantii]|uniref:GNAT family N-acetyltransferase n=1 Tax=Dickeya dadantii TaxID=204038 RepID=UPI001CF40470|nr:GNAT family N-acetyltransferase [Dickeya dadantii]MCA7015313.1 GNAT family N-acetyltransferase [Dickeya dadantii]
MSLVDFTPADYPRLIRWVDSAELNLLWGGPTYSFPLTATQITDHLANPQFVPYLFEHQGDIVGFVELYQVEPHHSRLCRVFIDPAYRGRGLARAMLQAAIRQAVERFEAQAVSLSVFSHNRSALRCYQSLGFHITATAPFGDQGLELTTMRLIPSCA